MKTAVDLPDELMRAVKIRAIEESRTLTDLIAEYLRRGLAQRETSSPKLWMDAYLAAFAITGVYRFVTIDKAFSPFDGLDLVLPGATDS